MRHCQTTCAYKIIPFPCTINICIYNQRQTHTFFILYYMVVKIKKSFHCALTIFNISSCTVIKFTVVIETKNIIIPT